MSRALNLLFAVFLVGLLAASVQADRAYVLDWTRQIGTANYVAGDDEIFAVDTDASGNVFVSGFTHDTDSGNQHLTDSFVSKYDSSGTLLWRNQWEQPEFQKSYGVATDTTGNAFSTGYTTFTATNDMDIFLRKFDFNTTGASAWDTKIGTTANDFGSSVATDLSGNIFISGWTTGDMDGTNAGLKDAFVIKRDSSGGHVWMRQLGTSSLEESSAVTTDSSGNVFISGFTKGLLGTLGGSNVGGYDGFLSKYNTSGTLQWTRQFGTPGDDYSSGVVTDSAGNIYVSGRTGGSLDGQAYYGGTDAFVSKYNSSGTQVWTRVLGTSTNDGSYSVDLDASGNVVISGFTDGDLEGTSAGATDAFLSKYDGSTGSLLWTNQLGTAEQDVSHAVAVDASGNVFIGGRTNGNLGGTNLAPPDGFLSKFTLPPAVSAQWDGTGNWTDATGLWTGTAAGTPDPPPSSGDHVNVRSGKLTYSSGNFSGGNFYIGHHGQGADTTHIPSDAEFVMTGGTMNISGHPDLYGSNNSSVKISLSGSAALSLTDAAKEFKMMYYCAGSEAQYTNTTTTITLDDTSTLDVAGVLIFGSKHGTPGSSNVFTINLNDTSMLTVDNTVSIQEVGPAGAKLRLLNLNGGTLKILGTDQSLSTAIWITGLGGTGGTWGGTIAGDTSTYTAWSTGGYTYYQGTSGVFVQPGDFDNDGDVDGVDFGIWQDSYPMASGATLGNGDTDNDGDVDGVDFGVWQDNYPTAAPASTAGGATVPEPAALGLLLAGGILLLRRRRVTKGYLVRTEAQMRRKCLDLKTKVMLLAIAFLAMGLTAGSAMAVEIQVTVNQPTLMNSIVKMNMGSITYSREGIVGVFYPKDQPNGGTYHLLQTSTDAGLTWSGETWAPSHDGGAQEIGLSGGGVIKLKTFIYDDIGGEGWYRIPTQHGTDDFTGWTLDNTAKVYVPDHEPAGDVPLPGLSKGPIIEIPAGYSGGGVNAGDLLMPMYGHFTDDNFHRSYLVRSTDLGVTWRYHETMAYFDSDPTGGGGEFAGCVEPTVAYLPNGDLLAIIRTNGDPLGRPAGNYRPLYTTKSSDGGLTWTTPTIAVVKAGETHPELDSNSPTLAVLENGVVALEYGRPGFHVAFSSDYGATWGDILHLDPLELPSGPSSGGDIRSTGQFDMTKAGPNKLVAFGSDAGGSRTWPITVNLKGDVNNDGWVDDDDWDIIVANLNGYGNREQGDLTGNGYIDATDQAEWNTHKYTGIINPSPAATVPEPATMGMVLVGGLLLLRTKRR